MDAGSCVGILILITAIRCASRITRTETLTILFYRKKVMKVKELIEELSKMDGEREVILQKDGEGNGYSPLYDLDAGAYVPDTTWSGDVLYEELTDELRRRGYAGEDCIDPGAIPGVDYLPAVILCPTN